MTPPSPELHSRFWRLLVAWQLEHGRHALPWQGTRDPYRVWLSEIMLQQTQVTTVLGYYARFLVRFPDVLALADADLDEVFALWSGLGYYSRARNLHRCAQRVKAEHGGAFPTTAAALQMLPGIGPSTAAAIAAFCFEERSAILDGNVKRVLSRVLAFDGDLSRGPPQKQLWQHAHDLLPGVSDGAHMPAYTQALMDLGATICLPRQPQCERCPVRSLCVGAEGGEPERFPVKSRRLKRTSEAWWLLFWRRGDGAVWLQQRPLVGIWAGLYGPPVYASGEALDAALQAHLPAVSRHLGARKHMLTHKDLHLHPVLVAWSQTEAGPDAAGGWVHPSLWTAIGLPTPIRDILNGLPP